MLSNDLAFGGNHDAVGVDADTDRQVGERGRHAVAITLEGDKAGRRNTLGVLEIPRGDSTLGGRS